MTARYVLGVVLSVNEDVAGSKAIVRVDLSKFAGDLIGHHFRDRDRRDDQLTGHR